MVRSEFTKLCGAGCLGLSFFGTILQSCGSTKIINSSIEGDHMIVPVSEFEMIKNEKIRYRPYLVAQNNLLKYPICIYRHNANEYSALLMRCTHQGTELQVFGDRLQCPAHGSEFGNKGNVTNGPASTDLRTFPVIIDNNQLKIFLG